MCSSERKAHIDGKLFEKALFETADNGMTGSFNYSSLLRRLAHIRTAIDSETRDWARQGMIAAQTQSGPAENLRLQFEQVRQWTADSSCMVALELEDDNPFVWIVNILGLPMTPFDEGHWLIKISLSPDFPNDQPRIRFLTPFFHPNVTGTLPACSPDTSRRMQAHVNAIIAFFDLDNIITDPSCTLNTDAARLWCGTELQKKEYKRKTRQMVLKSVE
ncbi:Ubiquitin-conjugating enzyme E2 2 [Neolecta irregularis DAH-3]|uniref:Ubiquitin-conjugating enzyme E2 2 n=1 Tax=Neolecta irregularis (strain DAH-3) TaxID=1198029 RepID=A0A1U7LIQ4_NEOID|nr:Ubiquitin-conjugating enzyme E2 2 [Neolecta irregularis DAH-3]|eukprot:OLL22508.1 Ubiquitin-conjugating enzyme E2 2 [Neolecta irregularis DAH-3]